jgi:hypothetical protein
MQTPLSFSQAATRDADRLAEALQQHADDAQQQRRDLEQQHAHTVATCRADAAASVSRAQQQHDAALRGLEARHRAELDASGAKLHNEHANALAEVQSQGAAWRAKAAGAAARAEEALAGRAAAEARARDALDREIKRLREVTRAAARANSFGRFLLSSSPLMPLPARLCIQLTPPPPSLPFSLRGPQVQADSLHQLAARAEAKEHAFAAARVSDQHAAAQRERALVAEADAQAVAHREALSAAQAAKSAGSEAVVRAAEKAVASEYDTLIRTLKVGVA